LKKAVFSDVFIHFFLATAVMHHSKHQLLLEKYIEKYSLLQISFLCKVLFLFFYDEM